MSADSAASKCKPNLKGNFRRERLRDSRRHDKRFKFQLIDESKPALNSEFKFKVPKKKQWTIRRALNNQQFSSSEPRRETPVYSGDGQSERDIASRTSISSICLLDLSRVPVHQLANNSARAGSNTSGLSLPPVRSTTGRDDHLRLLTDTNSANYVPLLKRSKHSRDLFEDSEYTNILPTSTLTDRVEYSSACSTGISTSACLPQSHRVENYSRPSLQCTSTNSRHNTVQAVGLTRTAISDVREPANRATSSPIGQQSDALNCLRNCRPTERSVLIGKENIPPRSMPDSAPEGKVDLEQLLKSETARASFQSFLQQQFCIENLNFYLAVEEYKLLTSEQQRRQLGRQIYERHFTPNSIEPVNIDNATCKGIMESIQTENYSQDMYNLAQYQIYHLLKYDCWPRYLSSGGKAPSASEILADSKKDKGNGSGASTARSTNSAQLNTSSEKREKRKSFFRFLRRNNKEPSQDNSSTATCSATPNKPEPGPSGSGVYTEPYAGSVGDLNLSLSPATTKRRMTRERSVPSRSSTTPATEMLDNEDEDSDSRSPSLHRKTRAMSSRESNNISDLPSSPVQTSATSPTTTARLTATSTHSSSTQKRLSNQVLTSNKATGSATTPCSPTASRTKYATGTTSSIDVPDLTVHSSTVDTSILHDEKERFLRSSAAVMQQLDRLKASGNETNHATTDVGTMNMRCSETTSRLPPLFTSAVGSGKETIPPSDNIEPTAGLQWQKADYV
ncbi:RGS domain-containing protein [Aphelenchoides besseyi]|nr:RGS domain-containing protein [Aphelenchoides besseyi]KAI6201021.1 RGS domain-containing protein [Aphelenchoides besseyi]